MSSVPSQSELAASSPPAPKQKLDALRAALAGVIRGKEDRLETLIVALLAGGSVLLEDVPGVGKTTLAKSVAAVVDLSFNRVQFTPDLLPSDILGSSIYNPVDGDFHFRGGPIFCNVLLADEINRASPRTQSALLEAMSETQATIEGVRHRLPVPFFVLATQNPIDYHGTYPLPEAQLDRFLVYLDLGYPDAETELEILYDQAEDHPLDRLTAILTQSELLALQKQVRTISVEESVGRYLISLVGQSRRDDRLQLGVSPRGALMLFRASQASALLAGRDYVLPDDVQRIAPAVLAHRIILTDKAKYSGNRKVLVIEEILEKVRVPT